MSRVAVLEKTAADLAAIWRTATNAEKKASAECFAVLKSIADIERLPHVMNSGVVAERYQEVESFGQGGSAAVQANFPVIPVTTSAARFEVALDVPSNAGKTILGNGDDFSEVQFLRTAAPPPSSRNHRKRRCAPASASIARASMSARRRRRMLAQVPANGAFRQRGRRLPRTGLARCASARRCASRRR